MTNEQRYGDMTHTFKLVAKAFGISGSEAKRLIKQGGVRVNGEVVMPGEMIIPVNGDIIQIGKRRFRKVQIV